MSLSKKAVKTFQSFCIKKKIKIKGMAKHKKNLLHTAYQKASKQDNEIVEEAEGILIKANHVIGWRFTLWSIAYTHGGKHVI